MQDSVVAGLNTPPVTPRRDSVLAGLSYFVVSSGTLPGVLCHGVVLCRLNAALCCRHNSLHTAQKSTNCAAAAVIRDPNQAAHTNMRAWLCHRTRGFLLRSGCHWPVAQGWDGCLGYGLCEGCRTFRQPASHQVLCCGKMCKRAWAGAGVDPP